MKKLWFSSILIIIVLTACKQRTATETEPLADTSVLRVDSSVAPPDRTEVEPDTTPAFDTISGISESKQPGAKPKPGKPSQIDSIKDSYPPKK